MRHLTGAIKELILWKTQFVKKFKSKAMINFTLCEVTEGTDASVSGTIPQPGVCSIVLLPCFSCIDVHMECPTMNHFSPEVK